MLFDEFMAAYTAEDVRRVVHKIASTEGVTYSLEKTIFHVRENGRQFSAYLSGSVYELVQEELCHISAKKNH